MNGQLNDLKILGIFSQLKKYYKSQFGMNEKNVEDVNGT